MRDDESHNRRLGIRWTIGDVNPEGFEALQLSISGAWNIFRDSALYLVCVNSMSVDEACNRTGDLPVAVEWKGISRRDLPSFLKCTDTMAEGTGWKLCPVHAFHGFPELSLDNDCILWGLPSAVERWLDQDTECLIAEDVRPHFGCFASRCGMYGRNSGIRGLPSHFPLEEVLVELMNTVGELKTEGDEQGLQVASAHARGKPEIVPLSDVTICSPFPPHLKVLGNCGAHFVGLNTRRFNWSCDGRDPVEMTRDHWNRIKPQVIAKVFA